jgi:hypothetical protein
MQFWASFVAAFLFIFVGIRLNYIFGSLLWVDLNYLGYYYNFGYDFYLYNTLIFIIIFLILAIFLKMGIFPFYF